MSRSSPGLREKAHALAFSGSTLRPRLEPTSRCEYDGSDLVSQTGQNMKDIFPWLLNLYVKYIHIGYFEKSYLEVWGFRIIYPKMCLCRMQFVLN